MTGALLGRRGGVKQAAIAASHPRDEACASLTFDASDRTNLSGRCMRRSEERVSRARLSADNRPVEIDLFEDDRLRQRYFFADRHHGDFPELFASKRLTKLLERQGEPLCGSTVANHDSIGDLLSTCCGWPGWRWGLRLPTAQPPTPSPANRSRCS